MVFEINELLYKQSPDSLEACITLKFTEHGKCKYCEHEIHRVVWKRETLFPYGDKREVIVEALEALARSVKEGY